MKTERNQESIIMLPIPTPFPVGDINAYLYKGESLTLIDAGPKTEEALVSLKTQVEKAGYRLEDIEQVIVTHHHPDHVGLLDELKGARFVGHPYNEPWLSRDREFIETQKAFFHGLLMEFGVDPVFLKYIKNLERSLAFSCTVSLDQTVKGGDHVPGMDGFRVIETPGHAQTHIALYREADGVLFGGDVLLKKISANPLLEPPMEGTERPKPQLQFNDTFEKLLHLPISKVYSGHGEVIENAHELIHYRRKRQADRAEEVRKMLAEKQMTAFQVCTELFPTVFHKELMLTMSETVAQLDYLEKLGKIASDGSNENRMYFA
ncbi:MBL fold metallo-hydrolase [Bacillus sp. FJAT-42376]|uniref:MBL fold metallo-hydrolase n=1 Tax=Bacillus sp. FJAT-42376 TaxID=2014076 RepID=UPI000F4E6788|nr:MBL fold metallo-hydrolase [Bacillus sp. FJAT-42376]AZB43459.1 MBL fold metallo-hydrolase [Bacillus sp. FJAT-42376]